jgi:hypothetical protein
VSGGISPQEDGKGPVLVEIDTGSAISWDRPPSRCFLVRLRRGDDHLIIPAALSRPSAESLAERLAQLLA